MRLEQYKHQQAEYDHRGDRARAYFWQMRTGKSKMVIDNACWLAGQGEIDGVLVLAPNGVHLNWTRKELPTHMWNEFNYNALAWRFSQRDMPEQFKAFIDDCAFVDLSWFAINLESMTRPEIKNALRRFERLCPNFLLVVDESHHFRRPGAKRTARARAIARRAKYVRILSGTSLDNSALHAFSQFELLEKGALGFTRFDDFKEHYATFKTLRTRGNRKYEALDSYKNLDELKERMAPFTSVVLREDCDDLPDLIPDQRLIEPSNRQVTLYRALLKMDLHELEEIDIYSPLDGGAKMNKLQQVLSGFVYDDAGKPKVLPGGNPRLEALAEELELDDCRCVVWCRFTQDILFVADMLRKKGITFTEYHGKMNQDVREEGYLNFQRDDGPRVLIGQPQAGGEGLDMSQASKIIWYTQISDNIVRTQANERATKIGGKSIQLIDFLVPDSVDEYYLGLIADKRSVADDVSRYGLRAVLEKVRI